MLIPSTDDRQSIARALTDDAPLLVACLCAAWCRTCDGLRPAIEDWARTRADLALVWLDVEDDAELVEDMEVENFPTILVQRGAETLFFGPVPPRVSNVERVVEATARGGAAQAGEVPDLRARLLGAAD